MNPSRHALNPAIWITAAAGYCFFLALVTALALSRFGGQLAWHPAKIFNLAVLCWSLSTGVGLLLRKAWARISLVATSRATVLLGVLWAISTIRTPPLRATLLVSSCCWVAVSIGWLVLLSRPAVKCAFGESVRHRHLHSSEN